MAWPFDWWLRAVMVSGGLVLIALLVTARMLEPDSAGFGTHRQLGLPPCSSQMMFGFRCPACGMTTSWAYLTRGNVLASLAVNSGGTMLGIVAMLTGPWLLASGVRGRWVGRPPHEYVMIGSCITVTLVIVTDWVLRLLLD